MPTKIYHKSMAESLGKIIPVLIPLLELLAPPDRLFVLSLLDRIPGLAVPQGDLRLPLPLAWLRDEAARIGCLEYFTLCELDILVVSVLLSNFQKRTNPEEVVSFVLPGMVVYSFRDRHCDQEAPGSQITWSALPV
jgi:hypothetical protein